MYYLLGIIQVAFALQQPCICISGFRNFSGVVSTFVISIFVLQHELAVTANSLDIYSSAHCTCLTNRVIISLLCKTIVHPVTSSHIVSGGYKSLKMIFVGHERFQQQQPSVILKGNIMVVKGSYYVRINSLVMCNLMCSAGAKRL